MKKTGQVRRVRRRHAAPVAPSGGAVAEPIDVSWHYEEFRAAILWGRPSSAGGRIQPAVKEE